MSGPELHRCVAAQLLPRVGDRLDRSLLVERRLREPTAQGCVNRDLGCVSNNARASGWRVHCTIRRGRGDSPPLRCRRNGSVRSTVPVEVGALLQADDQLCRLRAMAVRRVAHRLFGGTRCHSNSCPLVAVASLRTAWSPSASLERWVEEHDRGCVGGRRGRC